MLEFRPRRSQAKARAFVLEVVRHGNHYVDDVRQLSEADITLGFERRGYRFHELVQQMRSLDERVPFFENLIGSTWSTGEGATLSYVRGDGSVVGQVEGPGSISSSTSWSALEAAVDARDRAMTGDLGSFRALLTDGVAAIESFIREQAEEWNHAGNTPALRDSTEVRASFDDKVKQWIPVMTGQSLELGGRVWQDFRAFRALRDDVVVHAKSSVYGWSLADQARIVNLFRSVAQLLLEAYKLFGLRVPAVIIRAAYVTDALPTAADGLAPVSG